MIVTQIRAAYGVQSYQHAINYIQQYPRTQEGIGFHYSKLWLWLWF